MKKILIILFLFMVVTLVFNKEEKTKMVFNETRDEMVLVNLIIPNLNTNNFENYFSSDLEIIGIYPKINKIYKDRVKNTFYKFTKIDINTNINTFIKYYKNLLKNNNFNYDLTMIDYNGIAIDKVMVYINDIDLQEYLKKCLDCTYEKK